MASYTRSYSLGKGGFGEVFACARDSDGERFAMKVLLPDQSDDTLARFRREVWLLSSLDHPNVIKVVDLQLEEEPLSYVMPHYDTSLRKELKNVVGNDARITKIFTAILDGVEYAHAEGVIHRDLKPANVLLNNDSDVVVSDFGLGRRLDSESHLTASMLGMGSALYSAPEQWVDGRTVDERADIFSLGRMLLELYTGPLTGTAQDTSNVPEAIALIVNRCTQADPAKRFPSVTRLKQAFVSLKDVGQAAGQLDEFLALRAQLSIPGVHEIAELDRFVDLLATHHRRDEHLLHQTMMIVHADAIGALVAVRPQVMKTLIDRFAYDAARRQWAFSYTDRIADQCRGIFSAVIDAEVRASLAVAVALIGVVHKRWHVLGVAQTLLQGGKSPAERVALMARLEGLDQGVLGQIAASLDATQVDQALRPYLTAGGSVGA